MLSIVCPSRGGSELLEWLIYHLNFFDKKLNFDWELIICVETGVNFSLPKHPQLQLLVCEGESFFLRNYTAFCHAKYDLVFRIADDDYVVAFDEKELSRISDEQIGLVPEVLFSTQQMPNQRLSDRNLKFANSNKADLQNKFPDARITNYLEPPLPGDNSCYWGIYKKQVLLDICEQHGNFYREQFVASDWVFMAHLLSKGPVVRALSWTNIRHLTSFQTTMAEKNISSLFDKNYAPILNFLPLLPALTFIRQFIMEDPLVIWKSTNKWHLQKFQQIQDHHGSESKFMDQLDVLLVSQKTEWVTENGLFLDVFPHSIKKADFFRN